MLAKRARRSYPTIYILIGIQRVVDGITTVVILFGGTIGDGGVMVVLGGVPIIGI